MGTGILGKKQPAMAAFLLRRKNTALRYLFLLKRCVLLFVTVHKQQKSAYRLTDWKIQMKRRMM